MRTIAGWPATPMAAAAAAATVVAGATHAAGGPWWLTSLLAVLSACGVVGGAWRHRAAARARTLSDIGARVLAASTGLEAPSFRITGDADLVALGRTLEDGFGVVGGQRAELRRDRARLAAILSGMVEGVLVVNATGEVDLVNEAARHLLRLPASALGHRYEELIRHPDVAAQITRALQGGMPGGVELSLNRDPGQIFVARAAPVVAGADHGAVLVLHDITDLRRADRIRRDFVANVSHELRTPLTAIRGYVEALLEAPLDPDDTSRFLGVVARHAQRMETLVKDLLRLARLDAGQEAIDRAACAVGQIWSGVAAELAPALEARRQTIHVDIAPDAGTVAGDPVMLHDIFRNLVENASNYSPEGSAITLDARLDGDLVQLRVLDEGPGIPDGDLQRIFERFYRVDKARSRETGGTGLGLSIVKHLVELHRGDVEAGNRGIRGAVFTLRLPRT